jgi:hypothetical protein
MIINNHCENKDLDDYLFSEEDRDKIEFDQYGRPYIQYDMGMIMLSRKTEYNYKFKN